MNEGSCKGPTALALQHLMRHSDTYASQRSGSVLSNERDSNNVSNDEPQHRTHAHLLAMNSVTYLRCNATV